MLRSTRRNTHKKLYYKLLPGVKGELLPAQYRDQFRRKQIICVEYNDVTEENEREIFQVSVPLHSDMLRSTELLYSVSYQRVQLGVALTPAGELLSFFH